MVVAESNVRYLVACRFEDELLIDSYVDRIGNTSLVPARLRGVPAGITTAN
jgi:acyl-CoA thioesterase FadM